MIKNKVLMAEPGYYKDWEIFTEIFPQEASFVNGFFAAVCKAQKIIYGKDTIRTILTEEIPLKFPKLKEDFQLQLPDTKLDAVLGIGLWKTLDSDQGEWIWEAHEGKKYTKV